MARTSDWPLGESIRVPAPSVPGRRSRGLPRVAWVLAAAAFACGALLSAAGFSIGWRHQAQRGSSAEAALAVATAHNHALTASLASARGATARTRAKLAAARADKAALKRDASSLATGLVSAGHDADSVSVGASTIGADLDRLAGELKTLTTYLTTTPSSQLDPGYVASQTAYLSKQLDRLQAERGDLGAAVASLDAAAKKLADRASALSGRN
jgi:hypothetical protein